MALMLASCSSSGVTVLILRDRLFRPCGAIPMGITPLVAPAPRLAALVAPAGPIPAPDATFAVTPRCVNSEPVAAPPPGARREPAAASPAPAPMPRPALCLSRLPVARDEVRDPTPPRAALSRLPVALAFAAEVRSDDPLLGLVRAALTPVEEPKRDFFPPVFPRPPRVAPMGAAGTMPERPGAPIEGDPALPSGTSPAAFVPELPIPDTCGDAMAEAALCGVVPTSQASSPLTLVPLPDAFAAVSSCNSLTSALSGLPVRIPSMWRSKSFLAVVAMSSNSASSVPPSDGGTDTSKRECTRGSARVRSGGMAYFA